MKSVNNSVVVVMCLLVSISLGMTSLDAFGDNNVTIESARKSGTADASFDKMMQVIMHKRCMNCHPSGNIPRQGEDSHLHYFDVQRGETGAGLHGYTCNTCHQNENNNYAGVPGAAHWVLAPASMAWEGNTRVEIAKKIMDPQTNGGKNADQILKHLTEDELVLWAFEPGLDAEGAPRELPPLSKEEWVSVVKEWINTGAIIPNK